MVFGERKIVPSFREATCRKFYSASYGLLTAMITKNTPYIACRTGKSMISL
jgi:hypothetical protein